MSPGTREVENRRKVRQTPNLENAQPELKKLLQWFQWDVPTDWHLSSLLFPPSLSPASNQVFGFSPCSWNLCPYLSISTLSPMHIPCLLSALARQKTPLKLKLLLTLITPTPSQIPALPSLPPCTQVNPFSCMPSSTALCSPQISCLFLISHLPFAFFSWIQAFDCAWKTEPFKGNVEWQVSPWSSDCSTANTSIL